MVNPTLVTDDQGQPPKDLPAGRRELSAEELRFSTKIDCTFVSTQELSRAKEFVGQERALAALELGLGVPGAGYNIFVSGLTADGGADEGNINDAVSRRLKELAVRLKEFAVTGRDGESEPKS
jgi:AAA domain